MATYQSLGGKVLQDFYHIEIVTDPKVKNKRVYFHSTIHSNKKAEIYPQFSTEFTDWEILYDIDIIQKIHSRYGSDIYRD